MREFILIVLEASFWKSQKFFQKKKFLIAHFLFNRRVLILHLMHGNTGIYVVLFSIIYVYFFIQRHLLILPYQRSNFFNHYKHVRPFVLGDSRNRKLHFKGIFPDMNIYAEISVQWSSSKTEYLFLWKSFQ